MSDRKHDGLEVDLPVKSNALRVESIKRFGRCPECDGEIDTGGECNDCGFDSRKEWKGQLP